MNFSEYRKLTPRTMSETGSKITNSIHMTLGLNTEVMGELPDAIAQEDIVNFKEEIGDAFWYLANYCNIWDLEPQSIEFPAEFFNQHKLDKSDGGQFMVIFSLGQTIALLQDLDKKELAYAKDGDSEMRRKLVNTIFVTLEYLGFIFGADTGKIRQTNIDKLIARYPDKFEAELANNRDLDNEREILEM